MKTHWFYIDKEELGLNKYIKQAEKNTKEEIEKELYYLTEENAELRRGLRVAKDAKKELERIKREIREGVYPGVDGFIRLRKDAGVGLEAIRQLRESKENARQLEENEERIKALMICYLGMEGM